MGNLMGALVTHSQQYLARRSVTSIWLHIYLICYDDREETLICLFRLSYTEELQCTILEVKAIGGFGTTIDVCLVNGRLKFGQTIVLPGTDGPIVTTVKVSEACWRNVHYI